MASNPEQLSLDKGQKPGDILLFLHPKGTSLLISWLTKSPYYHVAICDDIYHVIEARPRGVVRRDLRTKEGGHSFVVIPTGTTSGPDALHWAEGKIGGKYDSWDLVVILFDRIFTHLHINYKPTNNEFTCGSFVAKAFEEVGAPLLPGIKTNDVIPADFARFVPKTELDHPKIAQNK